MSVFIKIIKTPIIGITLKVQCGKCQTLKRKFPLSTYTYLHTQTRRRMGKLRIHTLVLWGNRPCCYEKYAIFACNNWQNKKWEYSVIINEISKKDFAHIFGKKIFYMCIGEQM